MSAAFPAGPYEVSWRKTKSPSWELRAADGRILTSSSTIIPEDEIDALGRLLKASPEMFALLERIITAVEAGDTGHAEDCAQERDNVVVAHDEGRPLADCSCWVGDARALLAKVRGQ